MTKEVKMIKIQTKHDGEIEIGERQIINFPMGLFGFDDAHQFALLDSGQPPFVRLQSLEDKELVFILLDPSFFRDDYDPRIAPHDLKIINLTGYDDEHRVSFAIVTIPDDQKKMSANLQGPIIINKKTREGCQLISEDLKWLTKHYILDELAQKSEA